MEGGRLEAELLALGGWVVNLMISHRLLFGGGPRSGGKDKV
jgi:hypothetical protein